MKKKVPLKILKALQPGKTENLELARIVVNPQFIVHLIDKDPNSDFFFKIGNNTDKGSRVDFSIDIMPASISKIKSTRILVNDEDSVVVHLTNWLSILKAYAEITTIFDDPILANNQKNFQEKFTFVDETADYIGFDLDQQQFINEYVERVKSHVLLLRETAIRKYPSGQLKEIENAANEIQANLTIETKSQIVKRLSKMWAICQKTGLEIIKEVFINVMSELTTRLLGGG